jgi:hypothetical protein
MCTVLVRSPIRCFAAASLALAFALPGCGGPEPKTGSDAERVAVTFATHLFSGRGQAAAAMIAPGASVPADPWTAELAADLAKSRYRRDGPPRRDGAWFLVPYASEYRSERSGHVCEIGDLRVSVAHVDGRLAVYEFQVDSERLEFGSRPNAPPCGRTASP